MKTETKHTTLPWINDPLQPTIWANGGEIKIATIDDLPRINGKSQWIEEQANAAFIIRACNSHYELLQACKAAIADANQTGCSENLAVIHTATIRQCMAAIAKATQ